MVEDTRQSLFRETIFALSSGPLPAGVAVVRVSGPGVRPLLSEMPGGLPHPRGAVLTTFATTSGVFIDRGLLLYFEAPHSFTGEDVAEFHLHGGRATVSSLLNFLGSLPGFRQADAGEFTRRAFLLGKIDLTEAEALADLIAAETEAQRRFALDNAMGRQSTLYLGWRERIIEVRAMLEAQLDFSDEGDVPPTLPVKAWQEVEAIGAEMTAHLERYERGEILRNGFKVVILGAPNAGKSSLLNALARREVAIVSDEPGTTRDLVEVALDLNGLKVVLTDTAGIREAAGPVEAIGIERALERAGSSNLLLLLEDAVTREIPPKLPSKAQHLHIATKVDLLETPRVGGFDIALSAKTGEGIGHLLDAIQSAASRAVGEMGEALPSRQRHVEALKACRSHLYAAAEVTTIDLEVRAEELRLASDALGRVVGTVGAEEILDAVFSGFCIGK